MTDWHNNLHVARFFFGQGQTAIPVPPSGALKSEGGTGAPEGGTGAPEGGTGAPEGGTGAPEGGTGAPDQKKNLAMW